MINLIKSIIRRIQAFLKLQRMNYEMKRSMRCITLISEAIIAGSVQPFEDEIVQELISLELTEISLVSDLTLMINCLLYLEQLESVSLDDSVDWSDVMRSVAYINNGVKLLSQTISWISLVKTMDVLSPNQIRYLNKYSDIAQYLLTKSKGNSTLTKQI